MFMFLPNEKQKVSRNKNCVVLKKIPENNNKFEKKT